MAAAVPCRRAPSRRPRLNTLLASHPTMRAQPTDRGVDQHVPLRAARRARDERAARQRGGRPGRGHPAAQAGGATARRAPAQQPCFDLPVSLCVFRSGAADVRAALAWHAPNGRTRPPACAGISPAKIRQVRDLKDEVALLRGGGPARGPLTPDERARLRARVEAFCDAAAAATEGSGGEGGAAAVAAAAAALTAGGDVVAIRACEWRGLPWRSAALLLIAQRRDAMRATHHLPTSPAIGAGRL